MKSILLILLTIVSLNVAGQSHLAGVKVGVSKTSITSGQFLGPHDYRTGISGGLTYEYLFKRHFSAGADIIYNQRGFTSDMVFTDDKGNPTGEKYKIKFNYDYVSVPVKAGFNLGNKLFGFANFGVIPSLLVDATTTSPTFDTDLKLTGHETFDITDRVTKFDFAGLVEIGGGYGFKNGLWLFSSLAYQHSFTTITNSKYFSMSEIRHNGMTLSIGVKRALSRDIRP